MKTKRRAPSLLWVLSAIFAVIATLIVLSLNLVRPDRPIPTIMPGSSSEPTYAVQIMRPREGLPLAGLLPPQWFGVNAHLGFDSKSDRASYQLESDKLILSGGGWEMSLLFDAQGQIQSESEILFDLIFEDRLRRVRCKAGNPAVGTIDREEIAANEFSGDFALELPVCEDAETGQSLGWPPRALILRGSFDRLLQGQRTE